MNVGRFVGAAIGVWVVRVALNWTYYTQVVGEQYEQMTAAHPDMFREVIPAYIAADLLFAVVFAYLFVKVGGALGGGLKGGVTLGVIVAVLSPVVYGVYHYYSFTYLPAGFVVGEAVFQLIAHAAQGAAAGQIYKS